MTPFLWILLFVNVNTVDGYVLEYDESGKPQGSGEDFKKTMHSPAVITEKKTKETDASDAII